MRATEKGSSGATGAGSTPNTLGGIGASSTPTNFGGGDRSPGMRFKVPPSSTTGQQHTVSAQSRGNSSSAIGGAVPTSPMVGRPALPKGSHRSCSPKGLDYLLPYQQQQQQQGAGGNRGKLEGDSQKASSGTLGVPQPSSITWSGHKDHTFSAAPDSPLLTGDVTGERDGTIGSSSIGTLGAQSPVRNGSGYSRFDFGPPKRRDRSTDAFPHSLESQSDTGSNRLNFLITDKDIETATDRARSESASGRKRVSGNKKLPDVREVLMEDYEDAAVEDEAPAASEGEKLDFSSSSSAVRIDGGLVAGRGRRIGGPPPVVRSAAGRSLADRLRPGPIPRGRTGAPGAPVSLGNQHAQSTGGLFDRVLADQTSSSAQSAASGTPGARFTYKPANESPEVLLHVYEVGQLPGPVHGLLAAMNTGAFHVGVEIYGIEYSYGLSVDPRRVCGLEASREPRKHPLHKYRNTIRLGPTHLNTQQVEQKVREMGPQWLGRDYDTIRRNCVTFAEHFCRELGTSPPPEFVGSLTRQLHGLIG